jgi:predicted nucleic acid-binding protein
MNSTSPSTCCGIFRFTDSAFCPRFVPQTMYRDALIWASAHISGCAVLLNEDMGTGATLAGVQWLNPFAAT